MTYSLSNNCTKNYYNRTLTVQVIVEDVVTWIFLRHSVVKNTLVAVTPLDPTGELTALPRPRPEARPRLRVKGRKGRKKGGNKQSGEGREKVKKR